MKKIIITTFIFLFVFCVKKENKIEPFVSHGPAVVAPSNKIMLFKINYYNYVFEGGKEIVLTNTIQTSDSIPFKIDYQSPTDFGNITIFHKPTNTLLFDGGIVWMGKGKLNYPASFDTSTTFVKTNNLIMQPDSTKFQRIKIYNSFDDLNLKKLWTSINNLQVTKDYFGYNKKIAVYLYTPSVGMGNPYEWDWIVFMSN